MAAQEPAQCSQSVGWLVGPSAAHC